MLCVLLVGTVQMVTLWLRDSYYELSSDDRGKNVLYVRGSFVGSNNKVRKVRSRVFSSFFLYFLTF